MTRPTLRQRLQAASSGILTDDRGVFVARPAYAVYLATLLREAAENRENHDAARKGPAD